LFIKSNCDLIKFIIFGIITACSNPLLYGWLNSNFKKEFKQILCCKSNGNSVTSPSQKLKGAESSFVVRKRLFDSEKNGSEKIKTELLKANNNEEMQEFTL
jgi:hypothetical protein